MKNLSAINKFLFLINYLFLIGQLLSYLAPFINPNIFWPIALFGLLFPVFIIVNILFIIYWLILVKKPALTNIVVLIIGLNSISVYISNAKNDKVDIQKSISIMSYNVRLFNAYEWIKDKNIENKILDFFDYIDSDILCIQEFYAPDKLPELNYNFRHIGLQNRRSQWHMAIYSKFPQINKGTVSIKGEKMNNTCIFSDMIIKEDTIRVYNIHLASNWFNKTDLAFIEKPGINKEALKKGIFSITMRLKKSFKKRAIQVEVIKNHIYTSPYPVIICGDFNDTPNSFAYNKLSKNLEDSFLQKGNGIGSTFLGKIPFLRIDYIFHSSHFSTTNFTIHKHEYSDHRAIESSFTY